MRLEFKYIFLYDFLIRQNMWLFPRFLIQFNACIDLE